MANFNELQCPQGQYLLHRIPHDKSNTLRAWDAADEMLLQYVDEHYNNDCNLLILNDSFGALSCALHQHTLQSISDSLVAQLACKNNLQKNQLAALGLHSSIDDQIPCDLVIAKVPKNSRLFEFQLQQINYFQSQGITVVFAVMQKYLSRTFIGLAQQHLEGVEISRAEKKAKLLIGRNISSADKPRLSKARVMHDYDLTVYDTPNVFAAEKIDIGCRFLLNNFPTLDSAKKIIDLGCGNGALGLKALTCSQAQVSFVDESYHALAAAKLAVTHIKDGTERSTFCLSNSLTQFTGGTADVILCNPPFHQQQSIADTIARLMFADAAKALNEQGRLYVVANRHLNYHDILKRHFRHIKTYTNDAKFVVIEAQR